LFKTFIKLIPILKKPDFSNRFTPTSQRNFQSFYNDFPRILRILMIPHSTCCNEIRSCKLGPCLVVLRLRQMVLGETCTSHAMHQHAFCSVGSTLPVFYCALSFGSLQVRFWRGVEMFCYWLVGFYQIIAFFPETNFLGLTIYSNIQVQFCLEAFLKLGCRNYQRRTKFFWCCFFMLPLIVFTSQSALWSETRPASRLV